jgi:rubrerythrin
MMGVQFNADEVFGMAEQIERNGAKFYRKAADGAAGETSREMLLKLAAMEDDHEKTFAAMRADLSQTEREPMVFDPEGETGMYLNAMADGYVFDVRTDPSEQLSGDEPVEHVLKTAIGLEKESVVFYQGLKQMVPEDAGKDRLEDIINQEMGHIALLSRELASRR